MVLHISDVANINSANLIQSHDRKWDSGKTNITKVGYCRIFSNLEIRQNISNTCHRYADIKVLKIHYRRIFVDHQS